MKRTLPILFILGLAASLAHAAELTVLAAASLSDSLKELQPAFTAETGHTLRFNFAASGALARQVKEGAPADVFISADELRVDQLQKAGLLKPESRRILLSNTLVVAVPADGGASLPDLTSLRSPDIRRIAIGDPATVPAGTYTRQLLESKGLWSALMEKYIPVDSVRASLAAVEAGNADVAFVYRTDALISKKVKIAFEVPASDGLKIVYPAAVVSDSKAPEAAEAFLAWLEKPAAQQVFARYGFLPPSH